MFRSLSFIAALLIVTSARVSAQSIDAPVRSSMSFESTSNDPADRNWDSTIGPWAHAVRAIAIDGEDVYIGGDFEYVDTIRVNHVAKWNRVTRRWSALGDGFDSTVLALEINGGHLYAAGIFTHSGATETRRIARISTGSSAPRWSALETGLDGIARAFESDGDKLYVVGDFRNAGSLSARGVALWHQGTWRRLSTGLDSSAYAIEKYGSQIVVGGPFTKAGGMDARHVAAWDGAGWRTLGTGATNGTESTVQALATDGSTLYAAGVFDSGGFGWIQFLTTWNGSSWNALDTVDVTGFATRIHDMAVVGGNVYVCGELTQNTVDGKVSGFARYELGSNMWRAAVKSSVSTPQVIVAYSISPTSDGVLLGGDFSISDSIVNVARLATGSVDRWTNVVGSISRTYGGLGSIVTADSREVFVYGSAYVAGDVTLLPREDSLQSIAVWDRMQGKWNALRSVFRDIDGMILADDSLFVHGATAAGEQLYAYVRSTKTWHPLSTAGNINEIAYDRSTRTLYMVRAGITNSIDRLRSGSWEKLLVVDSTTSYVGAIVCEGGNLYVDGQFPIRSAWSVAMFDGSYWTTTVAHPGSFRKIAVYHGDIYGFGIRGGITDTVGGRLYRYDTVTGRWSHVMIADQQLVSIASTPEGVYVGMGDWHATVENRSVLIKGTPYVVRVNGSAVSTLGSGISADLAATGEIAQVASLSNHGSGLYLTGRFRTAGGYPSENFAIWHQPPLRLAISADNEAIDVGTRPIDGVIDTSFTITNSDTSNGAITGTVSLPDGPFMLIAGDTTFTLNPGESQVYYVRYKAEREGDDTALVGIVHSGTNRGTMAVRLVGRTTGTTAVPGVPLPTALTLAVRPSPIVGEATIDYSLPGVGRYELDLVDLNGEVIARVASGEEGHGEHVARLSALPFPSGVYMLRLRYEGMQTSERVTIVR